MNAIKPFIMEYYCKEITSMIVAKYGFEPMKALREFLFSKTYGMLVDDRLEMWEFSPAGIFDMWENEKITGDPGNSLYLRRDEYA